MQTRIKYLDLARGMCMIMVVMCHLGGVIPKEYGHIYPEAFWIVMLPCFFILSGYFFKTSDNFTTLLAKKAKSLLIPYFVFSSPVYIYAAIWYFSHNGKSWSEVLETSSIHNDPIWFLFSLFILSIIFWALAKFLTERFFPMLVSSLGLAVAAYYVSQYTPVKNIILINSFEYLPYFTIGYFWKKNGYNIQGSGKFVLCALIYAAIAIPYNIDGNFRLLTLHSPLYFIGAVSGSYVLIWICSKIGSLIIIDFIGVNSLIFLASHQYFLFIVARGLHISYPWIALITVLVLTSFFAMAVNRYAPWLVGKRLPV